MLEAFHLINLNSAGLGPAFPIGLEILLADPSKAHETPGYGRGSGRKLSRTAALREAAAEGKIDGLIDGPQAEPIVYSEVLFGIGSLTRFTEVFLQSLLVGRPKVEALPDWIRLTFAKGAHRSLHGFGAFNLQEDQTRRHGHLLIQEKLRGSV